MNIIQLPAGQVSGRYKLTATKPDGSTRILADWFDNIVTDIGLNRWGTGTVISHCRVGTGNATPAATDTDLQAPLASTSTLASSRVAGTVSGPPGYGYVQSTFRFALGAVVGNVAEVGVGWSTTGATLFSRALISPAVAVTADEVLDVSYEVRMYHPTGDYSGTVTLSGTGYPWTARAALAPWNVYGSGSLSGPGNVVNFQAANVFGRAGDSGFQLYAGASTALGAVTGSPTGASQSMDSFNAGATVTDLAYVDSSLQLTARIDAGLNAANLTGGIKAIQYKTNRGFYQVLFTTAIPKDATKVLSLTLGAAWARRP